MKTGEEQQETEPGLLPGRRGKRATKKAAWRIARGYSGHLCWVLWGPVDSQLVSTLLVLSSDPPQHIVGQPCLSKNGPRPHGLAGPTRETDLRKVSQNKGMMGRIDYGDSRELL